MAKKVQDFDFSRSGSRPTKYPWEEWLDGSIWRLEKGEDFDVDTESFRSSVGTAADRLGKVARTAVPEDGVVVVQAYELSAEEKAERDKRNAEKARKAAETRKKNQTKSGRKGSSQKG